MDAQIVRSRKILELSTRVLCDTPPPRKCDGVFLFSQTANNQESVFAIANRLLNDGSASRVFFMNVPPVSGYPGYDAWREELKAGGVSEEKLEGVPLDDSQSLNTLIESRALIRFAKAKNYDHIYVSSPPFHQLRAFMTVTTVLLEEHPALHIYSKPGAALSWQDTVRHSQGSLSGTRRELIWSEMERIEKYQKKGDLGAFDAVLKYLEFRDRT